MTIHTQVGHVISVEPAFGVVAVMVKCEEGVCETVDFVMNQEEWLAFVAQGCEAMLKGDQ